MKKKNANEAEESVGTERTAKRLQFNNLRSTIKVQGGSYWMFLYFGIFFPLRRCYPLFENTYNSLKYLVSDFKNPMDAKIQTCKFSNFLKKFPVEIT